MRDRKQCVSFIYPDVTWTYQVSYGGFTSPVANVASPEHDRCGHSGRDTWDTDSHCGGYL